MAKRKLQSVHNVRAMPKKPLRLEGDHLYNWARMVSQLNQGRATLQEYGNACLREMGLEGDYIITDEAFILTREELHRLQNPTDGSLNEATPQDSEQ